MMLNLKMDGLVEEVINELVDKRIASNKTEAIRMAVLHYNEHYGIIPMNQYLEDKLAVKKMQAIDREIDEGKRKVISGEEFMKKYPELKKILKDD